MHYSHVGDGKIIRTKLCLLHTLTLVHMTFTPRNRIQSIRSRASLIDTSLAGTGTTFELKFLKHVLTYSKVTEFSVRLKCESIATYSSNNYFSLGGGGVSLPSGFSSVPANCSAFLFFDSVTLLASCNMDLRSFPHDSQACYLTFGSCRCICLNHRHILRKNCNISYIIILF